MEEKRGKGLIGWRYFLNATLSGANRLDMIVRVMVAVIATVVALLVLRSMPGWGPAIGFIILAFFIIAFLVTLWVPLHRMVRFECPRCSGGCHYGGYHDYGTSKSDPVYTCQWCHAKWIINEHVELRVFRVNRD